jgi:hypothetical protein
VGAQGCILNWKKMIIYHHMKVDMKKKSMVDALVVPIVEMLTCFLCVSNDNAPMEALERLLSFD